MPEHLPRSSVRLAQRGLVVGLLALAFFAPAAQAAALEFERAIPLPGVKGGFDLMAIDLAGDRFFLSAEDNGSLEIIDLEAARRIRSLGGMTQPKWVVYRPESRRIYVSNGDGKVRVFDSVSYAPGRVFRFRESANNLRFDATTGELFVGFGKTFGAIGIIDTRTDQVAAEIPLAAFPKQFELDGDRIYVNVPSANHVAVLSRARKSAVTTWPVAAAKDNVPMGFDRIHRRLFIGCEPGKLAVLDADNGREMAKVDIAASVDGVHYDAKRHLLYLSCGAGSIDVVRQLDPDRYEPVERLPTVPGAGTSLFVPDTDRYYLAVPAHNGRSAELRIYRPVSLAR